MNETRSAVRVIYFTEARLHRNPNGGKHTEDRFMSVEAAKKAPFPEGTTFAYIPVDNGCHVYHSSKFGWGFHKKAAVNEEN